MGKAPKVCAQPGCIGDARVKTGRCVEHEEKPWVRSTHAEKITSQFRRNRVKAMRATKGRCAFCGVTATAVDHILPVAWGGGDEVGNLQPICGDHHQTKTQIESQIGRHRDPVEMREHVSVWTAQIFRYRT